MVKRWRRSIVLIHFQTTTKITMMSMSIYEAIIALQRSAAAYASTATIPDNPAHARNPIQMNI